MKLRFDMSRHDDRVPISICWTSLERQLKSLVEGQLTIFRMTDYVALRLHIFSNSLVRQRIV